MGRWRVAVALKTNFINDHLNGWHYVTNLGAKLSIVVSLDIKTCNYWFLCLRPVLDVNGFVRQIAPTLKTHFSCVDYQKRIKMDGMGDFDKLGSGEDKGAFAYPTSFVYGLYLKVKKLFSQFWVGVSRSA